MTGKRVELMVPVGRPEVREMPMAERLSILDGKVLGVLCNRKHNAGPLLSRLMNQLSGRYSFSEAVYREKEAATPAPEKVLNELKEKCDLVLNAVGD